MKTAKCRGCGAEIIWTLTSNGKTMPVDAGATNGFGLESWDLDTDGNRYPVDPPRARSEAIHLSHFATCPNGDDFRKGGE